MSDPIPVPESPAAAPKVSILVISYNTREMTLACLRSVIAQTKTPFELIVLDNASADGSAAAIAAEHGYGPRVAQAVDRSHQAMGELQKETLKHIFAMRGVLRPDQAALFDAAVVKALTQPVG